MRIFTVILISWLVWLTAPIEQASAISKADKIRAKKLFEEAEVHYTVGRFQEALDDYSKAYEVARLAGFLFNIGQCHRELKQYDRALFFYEGYLREKPDAKNRVLVEDLIVETRRKIGEQEEQNRLNAEMAISLEAERLRQSKVSPPNAITADPKALDQGTATATPSPLVASSEPSKVDPESPLYKKWWFWTIVGSAVAIATGTTIYALSSGSKSELPAGTIGTVDFR
jgi:tetratricopeptide (TPR) repeat protein